MDSHKLENDVKLICIGCEEASRGSTCQGVAVSRAKKKSAMGTGQDMKKGELGEMLTRWRGQGRVVYGPRPSCHANDTVSIPPGRRSQRLQP